MSAGTVLIHRDEEHVGQTIYGSGHAYLNCKFIGCTIYVREANFRFEECGFAACVLHLDVLMVDKEIADRVIDFLYDFRRYMAPDPPAPPVEDGPELT